MPLLRLSFLLIGVALVAPALEASERATARAFERTADDPVERRRFLYAMPKGGDLHNHLDGAIYAENFIQWAADDGKCVNLDTLAIGTPPCDIEARRPALADLRYDGATVNRLIDAFSVRNYRLREVSGHNQFFSTFAKFAGAGVGREGDMLAEASSRAAAQNIPYLELMQSWGMFKAQYLANDAARFDPAAPVPELLGNSAITDLVADTIARLDRYEARRSDIQRCDDEAAVDGCNVTVRYLAQVIRTLPRKQVLAQTVLAARLVETDPRYVGINFVAPEDHPITLRDHAWQMRTIAAAMASVADERRRVSLHAGELSFGLVPPEYLGRHIGQAIDIAGASRIGHGVDIVHNAAYPALMRRMAERGIAVEVNLTSNDVILGIRGDEHPFEAYRRHGVPITLSTDDEGVSRIDLTHEYQRAADTYDLDYGTLKQISRNALQYSFLPGAPLFGSDGATASPCARARPDRDVSADCAAFLESSQKAALQWELEQRFAAFESSY